MADSLLAAVRHSHTEAACTTLLSAAHVAAEVDKCVGMVIMARQGTPGHWLGAPTSTAVRRAAAPAHIQAQKILPGCLACLQAGILGSQCPWCGGEYGTAAAAAVAAGLRALAVAQGILCSRLCLDGAYYPSLVVALLHFHPPSWLALCSASRCGATMRGWWRPCSRQAPTPTPRTAKVAGLPCTARCTGGSCASPRRCWGPTPAWRCQTGAGAAPWTTCQLSLRSMWSQEEMGTSSAGVGASAGGACRGLAVPHRHMRQPATAALGCKL